ncbi:protein kinase [Clostridium sp. ZBS15]|uniref:protein kinase domain-containing protein n=1 Tax=Clostridium sp. ZBS15 TaxID=2949969 RepID=UPI00207A0206|nr:protein kinase [Clostridium sp. ZBS15]
MIYETLKILAELFCGDTQGFYAYKSGGKLVEFFNSTYGFEDVYGQGFPSRWHYTQQRIVDLYENGKINLFLNDILSKRFIMKDCSVNEIGYIEKRNEIIQYLNEELISEGFKVVKINNEYCFVSEDEDLVFIGEGGFATVYKRKTNGLIVKKLKDDFLVDVGVKSRFKREYELTKSLNDINGVIKVYDFDSSSYYYTMECADKTLQSYIESTDLSEIEKIELIIRILEIMEIVHKRNIIHRDLSPLNILVINNEIKIADFGLGKDLNMFTSHQTMNTNGIGQYRYCAPEQFMMLKDGDKRSDVFSLGRIINFILTKDCVNNRHFLRSVIEKATNNDSVFRYNDASDLLKSVKRSIEYHNSVKKEEQIKNMINLGEYSIEVENYIYELAENELCREIIKSYKFKAAVIRFIGDSEDKALYILRSLDSSFVEECKSWEDFDPISDISYKVLDDDAFSFVAKEISANLLNYIAYDVNRFDAQRKIERLIDKGIEPLLEEMLC